MYPILVIILFSCTAQPWNKEAAKEWCMKDNKRYIDDGSITTEKASAICDCVAEKMFSKYKSEAELNADKYNQMLIGKECVEAVEAGNDSKEAPKTGLELATQNLKTDLRNSSKEGVHLDSVYVEMTGYVNLDYRLDNIDSKLINKKLFSDSVKADLNQQYQTNSTFKYFKENKIKIEVHYYDKNGVMLVYKTTD